MNIKGMNKAERERQSQNFAADFVQPHDSKGNLNPDFVRLYPQHVDKYFSDEEIKRAGYPKLAQKLATDRDNTERMKAYMREKFRRGAVANAPGMKGVVDNVKRK